MTWNRFALLASMLPLIGCGTTTATSTVAKVAEPREVNVVQQSKPLRAEKSTAAQSKDEPLRYTVRKAVGSTVAPAIPPVLLTAEHAKLCLVNVGDMFPALSLSQLGGDTTDLASLRGKQATVVLFWHPDRWMARTALIDMQRDIANQFQPEQVAVVGISVRQTQGAVQSSLNEAQASFPQLLDSDGAAFAKVGTAGLPRIYVLDPTGKIVWFDIEYSEGTRRDLWRTLAVMTKK